LSKLWRRDFFRLVAVQVLRIEISDGFLPVVFRNDVHGQQTLPALWRCSIVADSGTTFCFEVSTLPD
jgi:hypothetical protein